MAPARHPWLALGASILFLAGCSKERASTDGGTQQDAGLDAGPSGELIDAGLYLLTPLAPSPGGTCNPHAEQPSQFTDTTVEWGLGDGGLGMVGTTIVSADLDNDGYPDLIIEDGPQNAREVIPTYYDGGFHNLPDGGFLRFHAVLMNRPRPEGGRMFVDDTEGSGIFQVRGGSTTEFRMAHIAAVGDINNDGNPDVFSGTALATGRTVFDAGWDYDRSEILLNDGRGHFHLAMASDPTLLAQVGWNMMSSTLTDVDNDGLLDLFTSYWYPVYGISYSGMQAQLYLGQGDGTFSTITQSAGLGTDNSGSLASLLAGTNPRPSLSLNACDLNDDGYPDLLIGSYGGESNMLYQNNGAGGFVQIIQDAGYGGDSNYDYSQNQYYLCYCSAASHQGTAYCADAGPPQIQCGTPPDQYWSPGVSDAPALLYANGFTTTCRDMDGDGKADLFLANIRHWWAGAATDPSQLLLNTTPAGGSIGFERIPNDTSKILPAHLDPRGWNEGLQKAAAVDLDNDGRPDLLIGESDYAYQYGLIFIQQSDGTYQEVGESWGMHFPCMIGLSVADLDRDGDLDIIAGAGLWRDCSSGPGPGQPGYTTNEVHIFTNNASQHSRWLEVRLRGDGQGTNVMGIGARVTVTTQGVRQVQEMTSSYGLGAIGNDTGVLFFGLGDCASVDSIEVRWPNHALSIDTWADVPSNHLIELHQHDPTAYGVVLP
jgi:hypothetical protein